MSTYPELKKFMVAPFQEGLVRNTEPWLTPDNSFQILEDAFCWRERLKKRPGLRLSGGTPLSSRLSLKLGETTPQGTCSVNVSNPDPHNVIYSSQFIVGQSFSVGDEIFTITDLTSTTLLASGPGTGTFNAASGILALNGVTPSTPIYFYPSLPCISLITQELSDSEQGVLIAFDRSYAYTFTEGRWNRLGTALWTGNDSNKISAVNHREANTTRNFLYTVNHHDTMKYIGEPVTGEDPVWHELKPVLTHNAMGAVTAYLLSAKIIISYKNRLLCFNTLEGTDKAMKHPNRVRWSRNGNPADPANSWREDIPGRGGWLNATVREEITGVARLRDKIIVFFEHSVWELVYTGNPDLLFTWNRIDSELGVGSTGSVLEFDKHCLGIGNRGIIACDGTAVRRIDEKIPDLIFNIATPKQTPTGLYVPRESISGIRDFYRELIFWSYPTPSATSLYPDRTLINNYHNQTWATLDLGFTSFGYMDKARNPSATPPLFSDIATGNAQGFVHILDSDRSSDSESLYITSVEEDTASGNFIFYVANHGLKQNRYVKISGGTWKEGESPSGRIFEVDGVLDENRFSLNDLDADGNVIPLSVGTYSGGGYLVRSARPRLRSSQWTPGTPEGMRTRIVHMDFLVDRTMAGEFAVETYLNSEENSSVRDRASEGTLLGTNVVLTRALVQERDKRVQNKIWRRFSPQLQSSFLQIEINLNDKQSRNPVITESPLTISAIVFHLTEEGRLVR